MSSVQKHIAATIRHEALWLGLGLVFFLVQSVYFAQHIQPTLDEGTYPYKGYHYLTGRYTPYQDYGPWPNKMPLSFLIPGAVQLIFGVGLGTSRIYAVVLSVIMLIGVWLAARRLGGKWAAVALVGVMGFTPFFIELYSQGISQVLVACLLAWTLALAVGQQRKTWQIASGAFLAGVSVVTRENMAPLAVLLLLYLGWEHGFRRIFPAFVALLLPILVVHALYWPDILQHWNVWVPGFLHQLFREPAPSAEAGTTAAALAPVFFDRLYAFSHAFYTQIPFWAGMTGGVLMWVSMLFNGKRADKWPTFKPLVFLSGLLALLTAAHAAASLGGNYCLLCFENYIGFFAPAGWLLMALVWKQWCEYREAGLKIKFPFLTQAALAVTSVVQSALWGLGAAPLLAETVLNLQVPRMRDMQFLPGTTDLWRFLANKFGWTFDMQKYLLPSMTALGVGLLVCIVGLAISFYLKSRGKNGLWLPGWLFLALAIFVAPFLRLDSITRIGPCSENIVESYAAAGNQLAKTIPAGSRVYWQEAPIVELLYLPEVEVYPPQLNQSFSFQVGGDPDALYRAGFWNQALAERWLADADYVVVPTWAYTAEFVRSVEAESYTELTRTQPYSACSGNSDIRILINEE